MRTFKRTYTIFLMLISICLLMVEMQSCRKKQEDDFFKAEEKEEYSGGIATTFDFSVNAYNNPIPGMSSADFDKFQLGNSFNRNNWVSAPSSTTARDGLGPLYNALSCSSCHHLDGKGNPPETPEESLVSLVFRLSMPGTNEKGEPLPVPDYGDQLQNYSISGAVHEGTVRIDWTETSGSYSDGTTYTLRQPAYVFQNLNYGNFPADAMYSPRVALKMCGSGFFDAIDESTIQSFVDENDANRDGISGRANYVWDYSRNKTCLGRIGWKASQPSVRQQVAHAFLNDIGITSSIFPQENLWGMQTSIYQYDTLTNGGSPEISDVNLENVYFYTSALAIPGRRNVNDKTVLLGKNTFIKIGCSNCHKQEIKTGTHPDIPYLSNQIIHPYTDLLLHDMGPSLADGRQDGLATGREWRTAPLWGLGLQQTVNGHTYLLHDGRARSIEEAILWHGGEASGARDRFTRLSKERRDALITFLNTL